eukprot:TRINITY_DN9496_c0_g1_i9.p1 TRINITY_DN9496_c0_g1~~TRINITY_DN9496_c0_g1_i9.p1  ORF type:complete len:129 (+),score=18.48 TRINITY_DN9496_c0_g1_i9:219-605(+)
MEGKTCRAKEELTTGPITIIPESLWGMDGVEGIKPSRMDNWEKKRGGGRGTQKTWRENFCSNHHITVERSVLYIPPPQPTFNSVSSTVSHPMSSPGPDKFLAKNSPVCVYFRSIPEKIKHVSQTKGGR